MILQVIVKEGKIVDKMFLKYLSTLKDGLYAFNIRDIGKPKTINEYRKYYFFICEYLAEQSDTGYTKKEFHNLFKDKLLLENKNGSHYAPGYINYIKFNGGSGHIERSTKILNVFGWEQYISEVKNYVKENLNIYL